MPSSVQTVKTENATPNMVQAGNTRGKKRLARRVKETNKAHDANIGGVVAVICLTCLPGVGSRHSAKSPSETAKCTTPARIEVGSPRELRRGRGREKCRSNVAGEEE